MQPREPTYLEAKLGDLLAPTRRHCQDDASADPMAVLVAHVMSADAAECSSPESVLNDEPMLKAGRAYFSLLTENDRLPPGEQLTADELALPRALLLDFFLGRPEIQQRAQEVLALIERKFSERAFQQATILLQLFETDQSTRIQNERKLFYEDMIQRLGVRRRHPLSRDEVQRVRQHFGDIAQSLAEAGSFDAGDSARPLGRLFNRHPTDEQPILAASSVAGSNPSASRRRNFVAAETMPGFPGFTEAREQEAPSEAPAEADADPFMPLLRSLDWLARTHQIHFCVQLRHPGELRQWEQVAALNRSGDALLRAVPPLRWRLATDYPNIPFMELVGRHMTSAALREHVRTMTKACYFILLAVGDTGLEPYIDAYFGWLRDSLGVNGAVFMDRLHRESTLGEQTLQETLDAIFDEFFAAPMAGMPYSFNEADILAAVQSFVHQMRDATLGEVAPGYFDLGGFLIDALLKVPYPTLEFPFRIHRIV